MTPLARISLYALGAIAFLAISLLCAMISGILLYAAGYVGTILTPSRLFGGAALFAVLYTIFHRD